MTTESVEQRLQNLEEENKKFKLEIERAQAVNEIRNIMDRVQAYHTANLDDQIQTLFASRADSKVYIMQDGSFEGPDCSERAAGLYERTGEQVGHMPIHLMCNPIIEVAADGQTAQATFTAVGVVAGKNRETGEPTCMWEWNRYGEDFIKEDGQWKLWHHHLYPLFNVGWDDKWAEQFAPKERGERRILNKPDYPPTPLDVGYNPDTELPFIPIPKPYETWDPNMAY